MGTSIDARLGRAIVITTFFFFMLTSGREPPWGDGNVQYMVAESVAHHGSLAIPKPWPDDLPRGRNGHFYSTYPIATSLVQLPGVLLLDAVPGGKGLAKPLTSHLATALFGALACLFFFRLCRERELSRRSSSIATACLAVASTIWVYAHYSYSETAQAAWFTAFVLEVVRFRADSTPGRARWLGLYAGLLFGTKYIYAVAVAGGFAYLAFALRDRRRELVRGIPHVALAAAPSLVLALAYNWLCWGSPFGTGYAPYFATYWGENSMVGLWGMFLSPGKSVFLYSPLLLLGFVVLPRLWRAHRTVCIAVAWTLGPVLAVYSRYKLNGDYAWGPRFLVFAVPVLSFGFAVLLDAWRSEPARRWRRAVLAGAVGIAIAVQLLGNAFYWDHFIRISMTAHTAWLGQPNRHGAIIPVRADGRCDSCFEDIHHLEWLPPFQPIRGHIWLLEATLAGDDALTAETYAPWHEYTSLPLDIAGDYARVRIDWWGLLWLVDFPDTRVAGALLLALLLAGTALGARAWRRRHTDDEPAASLHPPG